MHTLVLSSRAAVVAVDRVLPGAGTNGYISEWGAKLAGLAPGRTAA